MECPYSIVYLFSLNWSLNLPGLSFITYCHSFFHLRFFTTLPLWKALEMAVQIVRGLLKYLKMLRCHHFFIACYVRNKLCAHLNMFTNPFWMPWGGGSVFVLGEGARVLQPKILLFFLVISNKKAFSVLWWWSWRVLRTSCGSWFDAINSGYRGIWTLVFRLSIVIFNLLFNLEIKWKACLFIWRKFRGFWLQWKQHNSWNRKK